MKAVGLGFRRNDLFQGLLLHCQVGFHILMRGVETFVPQPKGDHFGSNPRFEQAHGAGMPEQMRADGASAEGGLLGRCALDQFPNLTDGSKASQRLAVTIRQERHGGSQSIVANPPTEQALRLAPQWKRAALATFALKFHLFGLGPQHILNPERQEFGNAGSRVIEQHEQQLDTGVLLGQ